MAIGGDAAGGNRQPDGRRYDGGGALHPGQFGPLSRIKDIAALQSARDNQLVGYGLVIGLQGIGRQPAQLALHRAVDPRHAGNLGIATRRRPARAPRTSPP